MGGECDCFVSSDQFDLAAGCNIRGEKSKNSGVWLLFQLKAMVDAVGILDSPAKLFAA